MDGIIRPEDLYGVEIHEADGIYLRQIIIPTSGSIIPQHAHAYPHLTMLVRGEVYFSGDNKIANYKAPAAIHVPRGIKHSFVTVTNDVEFWCIHNLRNSEDPEIVAEHHLATVS